MDKMCVMCVVLIKQ